MDACIKNDYKTIEQLVLDDNMSPNFYLTPEIETHMKRTIITYDIMGCNCLMVCAHYKNQEAFESLLKCKTLDINAIEQDVDHPTEIINFKSGYNILNFII